MGINVILSSVSDLPPLHHVRGGGGLMHAQQAPSLNYTLSSPFKTQDGPVLTILLPQLPYYAPYPLSASFYYVIRD